ncbi:MAG: hypothetical protein OQK56_05115 [Ignavibacteriaceae bacterium]|jgi:hypothetical protein|nr:hypothetical protein [Ignavibacteriaceae bacterium]
MKQLIFLSASLILLTSACSMLTLQPADFSWPVESAINVDDQGNVSEERYSTDFNTIGLFFEEFQDSMSYKGKEIRLIRNNWGDYFITSKQFKNVYVFKATEGTLVLEKKVFISEFGLKEPAFNQRTPYIELIDGDYKINLNSDGIVEDSGFSAEGGSK